MARIQIAHVFKKVYNRHMKKHKAMRLDIELIDKVQVLADKNNRSFTNMVAVILEKAVGKPVKSAAFVPPTFQDVEMYCIFRNNNVDASAFVAFYESKGWMIGKNKMQDWKKAIITWEKKDGKGNNGKTKSQKRDEAARRYLDECNGGDMAGTSGHEISP